MYPNRPHGPGTGFYVPPEEDLPGFRVAPQDSPGNPDIHLAKDPIRCSGPNSACEEWGPYKRRPNGLFRDIENPPFRLCPNCFRKTYGRPGTGDDTHLILPGGLKPPEAAG